jgi:hypothetical protein
MHVDEAIARHRPPSACRSSARGPLPSLDTLECLGLHHHCRASTGTLMVSALPSPQLVSPHRLLLSFGSVLACSQDPSDERELLQQVGNHEA